MADILSARVRIVCCCKVTFDVDLNDDVNFAKCPSCGDVCWVGLEAREHWTDATERPVDKGMTAVGVAVGNDGVIATMPMQEPRS